MAHTDKEYRDAALAMLPLGPAWNKMPGSVMYQFMWAIGACMAVLESDLSKLAYETRLNFTNELLPEWESDYAITPDPSLSIEQRRAQIRIRGQKKPMPSMDALIGLAGNVGYEIEIIRHLPFTCGDSNSQCGVTAREIGVTRSMIGINVLSSTGDMSLNDFTNYMESLLPAHVQLGVTVVS